MPQRQDSAIGQVVGGRYHILRQLGEGGMGSVYLAEHADLQTQFAVKVLLRDLADDEKLVARFRQEAKTASRIQHRNIVYITDFGQLKDGRLYLVMEYVKGRSLTTVMEKEGPLELPRTLRILMQVADAMHCAHEHGVVHRDLKPDNIMLVRKKGRREVVKLIDFGLAKALTDQHGPQTTDGKILGTPLYMSPEQCLAEAVDHRSDIYSFGTVAYECITNAPIFKSVRFVHLIRDHIENTPERPSRIRPSARIPRELDAVVMRCLQKKREERYQNFAQVHRHLGAILAHIDPARTRPSVPTFSSLPQTVDGWAEETTQSGRPAGIRDYATAGLTPTHTRDPVLDEFGMEEAEPGAWARTDPPSRTERYDATGLPAEPGEFSEPTHPEGPGEVAFEEEPTAAGREHSAATPKFFVDGPVDTVETSTGLPYSSWCDPRVQRCLQEIATKLMDQRMGASELLDVTVSILSLEEKAFDAASQVALGEARLEELEGTYQERGARLRRAVVELNLERAFLQDQAEQGSGDAKRIDDLSYQIAELERRLHHLERQASAELGAGREALERSRRTADSLQVEIEAKYRHLYELVQAVRADIREPSLLKGYDQLDLMISLSPPPHP